MCVCETHFFSFSEAGSLTALAFAKQNKLVSQQVPGSAPSVSRAQGLQACVSILAFHYVGSGDLNLVLHACKTSDPRLPTDHLPSPGDGISVYFV